MIKKFLSIFLVLLLGAACVTAGYFILDVQNANTAENAQPGVTKTEGRVLESKARIKVIEGKITKLTDKKIHLAIQGVDWELTLPETVRDAIKLMNEKGIEVKKGTYVNVQYETVNGDRVVKQVTRLISN